MKSITELTGFTCLFMASKNSEVDPIGIKDVQVYFLKDVYKLKRIIEQEQYIRNALGHENEVPTLFDFVMIFMKIWKLNSQKAFGN